MIDKLSSNPPVQLDCLLCHFCVQLGQLSLLGAYLPLQLCDLLPAGQAQTVPLLLKALMVILKMSVSVKGRATLSLE